MFLIIIIRFVFNVGCRVSLHKFKSININKLLGLLSSAQKLMTYKPLNNDLKVSYFFQLTQKHKKISNKKPIFKINKNSEINNFKNQIFYYMVELLGKARLYAQSAETH